MGLKVKPPRSIAPLQKQFFAEQQTLDGSPNLGLRVDSIYSRVTAISGPPIN